MNRRSFLKNTTASGIGILSPIPTSMLFAENITKITILHTNDVHSRIDPFPLDGSRNAGMGGAARRAAIIDAVRAKEEHVVLLDSGDIFQGTPYFNFFGGELEIELMKRMKYDASTLGNHDFDNGIDNLVKQMKTAGFPMINCNYDYQDNALSTITQEYKIIQRGEVKIGILGVGIELDGLVPKKLMGNTQYNDPIAKAQKTANKLKNELGCDLVICLSHLGYKYKESKVSDVKLALNTENIDLILGGHTHTFMKSPDLRRNMKGEPVIINQVGWAGIMMGRIDLTFEKNKKGKCVSCKNLFVE